MTGNLQLIAETLMHHPQRPLPDQRDAYLHKHAVAFFQGIAGAVSSAGTLLFQGGKTSTAANSPQGNEEGGGARIEGNTIAWATIVAAWLGLLGIALSVERKKQP